MKLSKSLILGTAVALTMIPYSLSAMSNAEQLEKKILAARACPAPKIIEQEAPVAQGWFSSFRQNAGNFLRKTGDELRTEGNKSAVGQVKEAVKDSFFAAASAKIGVCFTSVKDSICNSVGNAFRTVGQWIKGGEATQTTTRVILDNIGLNKGSKDYQVEQALNTVAKATLKIDRATALQEYGLVVDGLAKRGYATAAQLQATDVNAIYLTALAEEELKANANMTSDTFVQIIKFKGFDALENIKSVKAASVAKKSQIMEKHLKEIYEKIKVKQDVDNMRQAAPAA